MMFCLYVINSLVLKLTPQLTKLASVETCSSTAFHHTFSEYNLTGVEEYEFLETHQTPHEAGLRWGYSNSLYILNAFHGLG